MVQVEADDFSNEVCTLQSAAQSFTKADGQMVRLYLPAPAALTPGKFYMLSALIKVRHAVLVLAFLQGREPAGVVIMRICQSE